MRDAFISSIYKATKKNKNVMCLVGDIGAFLLREYIKDFPKNYYNLGVAEANMVGVASGLAMSGKIPFVYTITPFLTARVYEQIKVDVCYNNANVKLVGVGAGVSYSTMGSTHHSLDDIALMRVLPNITILSPADPKEAEEAIMAAAIHKGPTYIRITLKADDLDYKKSPFKIGKARVVTEGSDIAIIATGEMVKIAMDAASILKTKGISASVVNMHTIKPIDEKLIKKLISKVKAIITIEEHSIIGGLGSAVSAIVSENLKKVGFKSMGFRDDFVKEYTPNKYRIFEKQGLSREGLVKEALAILR